MTRPDTITLQLSRTHYRAALEHIGIAWQLGKESEHWRKSIGWGTYCRAIGYTISRATIEPPCA